MNSKDRLLLFITYKGIGQGKFEEVCGISNGYVNNNKGSFGASIVNRIHKAFPELNIEWLTTGDGDMIKDGESEAVAILNPNILEVPFISQYAYAGYLSGFSQGGYVETLPKVPFFVDNENHKGNYICVEVKGDSMNDGTEDSIIEGDKLLCREVKVDLWRSKLHIKKWDFVIVHKTDGILVKRIIKHDTDNCKITIHSLNEEYQDRIISLNDIAQIFNIIEISRPRRR